MLSVSQEQVDRITEAVARLAEGRIPDPVSTPPEHTEDAVGKLVACTNQLISAHQSFQPFLFALSRGDLEYETPRGRTALLDSLKQLQANLRHLTWKTQQVAKGDFSQRVDFMGAFSESFNAMVGQLASNREELLRKNQELETASRTDPLTGLLNRRGAGELLRREAHRTGRSRRTFVIVLADIDHFKRVNDTYGHDAGDAVLVELARILQGHVRQDDLCARWGGEEFLVLLAETDLPRASVAAERTRMAVASARVNSGGASIAVTISMGMSAYHEGESVEACIKRSDTCLYAAKESGRNQVWFQDDGVHAPQRAAGIENGPGSP